jgi:hypothetical protein
VGLLMDKSDDHGSDDGEQRTFVEVADDEEEEDTDDDEHRNAKRAKKIHGQEITTPHCDINFVKNTPYMLLSGSTQRVWGSGKSTDPAPRVPNARKDECKAGDYLLMKGSDIALKSTGNNNCKTSFEPQEELILTSDWDRFDEVMSGQDLVDLGDETFLLWWQNVKAPPVPKPKRATVAAKKKGKTRR